MLSGRTTACFAMGLLIGAAFGIGFGCGGLRGGAWSAPAHAEAVSPDEAAGVYQELDAGESALAQSSRMMTRIARVVTPSVVHIDSFRSHPTRGRVQESGSGVIVEFPKLPGTYVVTNRHVIFDAISDLRSISIHLHDGRVLHPQRALEDKFSDVAILSIDGNDLRPIRWADSDHVEIGSYAIACGSPFGLSQSVTLGIISARGRSSLGIGAKSGVLNQDFLQTDAAINPGNSGGPLLDLQGRLIGINTAIASTHGGSEGIGFSIPSNLVKYVVENLLQYGEVRRSYLGVKLDSEFDFESARSLQLYKVRGARVLEVYPETPAARAQLQANDVVLEFEGQEVLNESHLINLVSLSPLGRKVNVVIWRAGSRLTMTVDLTGRPLPTQPAN